MDLLKIVETEVTISQFTELKQAGMEIENGPRSSHQVPRAAPSPALPPIIGSRRFL